MLVHCLLSNLIICLQVAIFCLHSLVGREQRPEVVLQSRVFRPQVGQSFLVGLQRLSLLVYRFFGFDDVVLSLTDGGGRVAQLGCLEADRALIGLK